MKLNSIFTTNILDLYAKDGKKWLENLPSLVKQLSILWDFTFLKPLNNLSYSFIALVMRHGSQEKAVLKLAPMAQSLIPEAAWLRLINQSVPQVYEIDQDLNAMLMEYITPGYPLKNLVSAGQDDAASRIICQTIRQIQTKSYAMEEFPHLATLASSLNLLSGHFDEQLLSQAKTWFEELTADRSLDILLHGDLHHDNIIAGSSNNWKAIDPHGYQGDPAAEVGAMIRNPYDCFPNDKPLPKIIDRRLHILTEELPYDPKRIKAWAFCMTVLAAAWTFETNAKFNELEYQVACAINQCRI